MSTHSDEPVFAGSLGRGLNASAAPVEIRLGENGLEMGSPGGPTVWMWPYHRLRSSVPLSTKSSDVLLSFEPEGGYTLFVPDPAFAAQLLRKLPALSAGRQRWRAARPALAAVAAVLAIGLAAWRFELDPAQATARVMPRQTREAIGRQVISSISRDRNACETPASRAALDKLTQRLSAASPEKSMSVRVVVLDWNLINGFAVPGRQIILTRGLITAARSPDEVAGVLAHELGHAIELHPETGLIRAMGYTAASQLIFAGSAGTITNFGVLLTHLRHTRMAEREADQHAMRLLKGAGISSKGFGDFLERIYGDKPSAKPSTKGSSSNGKYSEGLEVIGTHPPTAERIAMVRSQPAYAATPALADADWRALRDACSGASAAPTEQPPPPQQPPQSQQKPAADSTADREIADATRILETKPNDVAALQKRARAYSRGQQHEQALVDYTRAIALKKGDAALHFGRGWANQSLRRYEDAVRDYDEAIKIAPDHAAARNGRGNSNRALQRYEAALTDFDHLIRFNPKFVAAYYNRALVLIDLKQPDDAIRDLTAAIDLDKDYAGAYAQRGLLRERSGARDQAIADFRAALAAPAKFESGAWAHRTARTRLKELGVEAK
jgi:beta-barrel assembly-enhancing protease